MLRFTAERSWQTPFLVGGIGQRVVGATVSRAAPPTMGVRIIGNVIFVRWHWTSSSRQSPSAADAAAAR